MKRLNLFLSVLVTAFLLTCGPAQQPSCEQQAPVPTQGTEAKIFNLSDIPVTELVPGADSQLLWSDNMQVSWLYMHPDMEFPLHNHKEEQIMIVREGSILQKLGDKEVEIGPGDVIIMPSNLMHGGKVGPNGCKVIDIFYPVREDYLQKVKDQHENPGF